MDNINEIIVEDKIFQKIFGGKCTYLVFVNDKNKQAYKENNILSLSSTDKNILSQLKVKINKLLYFPSIQDLLVMVGKENCGYTAKTTSDSLEDEFLKNYKPEQIEKFGYVAVGFELVKE